MKKNFYAVIMAGGKGERLWPLSRTKNPKPFIDILGKPLIKLTYQRLKKILPGENIIVIVPSYLSALVKKNLSNVKILREPVAKNTLATCVYSTFYIYKKNKKSVIGIFPADHVIKDEEKFREIVMFAFRNASDSLLTFGIEPQRPETGYGYIELEGSVYKENGLEIRSVRGFHEKPDREKALHYLRKGNFMWNSGMFVWRAETFINVLKEANYEVFKLLKHLENKNIKRFFEEVPETSIDYGLLEKTDKIHCIPSDFGWEDLGSFLSFENILEKDKDENSKVGDVIFVDSKGNIGFSKNKKVVFFRTENLVLVNTDDITLVFPKSESQDIKELMRILKKKLNKRYF